MLSRLTIVFLFTLALTACGDSVEKRDKYYSRAEQYYEQGKYEEARLELRNAIKLDRKFAKAHLLLGETYVQLKDWRKAFNSFGNAVENDPELLDAVLGLAKIYLLAGETGQAMDQAEKVLAKDPGNTDGRLIVAAALIRGDGDIHNATALLDGVLEETPENGDAYLLKAEMYWRQDLREDTLAVLEQGEAKVKEDKKLIQLRLGTYSLQMKRFEKAEEVYQRMVDENPDEPGARLLLAEAYMAEGRQEQALDTLKELIAEHPKEADYHLALARYYAAGNNTEQAEAVLRKGAEQVDDPYTLKLNLAELLTRSDRADEAIQTYQQIIDQDKEHPQAFEARKGLARIYLGRKDFEKAKQELDIVVRRNNKDAVARYLLGQMYIELNDPVQAVTELRQVVAARPRFVEAYGFLAHALFMSGDFLQGVEILKQALEQNPEYRPAREALIGYYLRNRMHDEALEQLEHIATQEGEKAAETRILMGDVHLALKEYDRAEEEYKKALDGAPENLAALLKLAGVYSAQERKEDALAQVEKVLDLEPRAFQAIEAKTLLLVGMERFQEAEDFCNAQLTGTPDDALVYDLLGRVVLAKGDYDQAEAFFEKSLELKPDWLAPYYRIGGLYIGTGRVQEGIAKFEEARKVDPDSLRTAFILGTLYQQAGQAEGAEEQYLFILDKRPDFLPAVNNLAYLYSESSDPEKLDKALTLAVEAAKVETPATLDTLGWVHYKRGNHEEALKWMIKAIDAGAEQPDIVYHYAVVLHANDRDYEARSVLDALLESGEKLPNEAEVRQLYQSLGQE